MITRLPRQSGFAVFEFLIIFVVVAVIGALGYTFYGRMNEKTAVNLNQSPTASDAQEAPQISRASDLDKAEEVINNTNPEISDSDFEDIEKMMAEF